MTRKLDIQADHLLWKQIVDKEDKRNILERDRYSSKKPYMEVDEKTVIQEKYHKILQRLAKPVTHQQASSSKNHSTATVTTQPTTSSSSSSINQTDFLSNTINKEAHKKLIEMEELLKNNRNDRKTILQEIRYCKKVLEMLQK